MPARRRHYPGRGPLTGTAGTRDAYTPCQRPGCGHPRVRHASGGPCAALIWADYYDTPDSPERVAEPCPCPAFKESE